jgi:hypothetical protein
MVAWLSSYGMDQVFIFVRVSRHKTVGLLFNFIPHRLHLKVEASGAQ